MDLYYDSSHPLDDSGQHRRLIRKLIYLTVSGTDITFVVRILSRFMRQPRGSLNSCSKDSCLL